MGNSAQLKEVRPDVRKKPQERRVSAGVGEAGCHPHLEQLGRSLLRGEDVWEQKVTQGDHLAFITLDPGLFHEISGSAIPNSLWWQLI